MNVRPAVFCALVIGACNSDRAREETARRPSPAAPIALFDDSFRLPAAERVVAVGDVHGDVLAAKTALRLAGAIDERDQWIGGKLVVVQTGDILDRGDDEPEILDLFDRLTEAAKAAGGAFHALNGNHEVMNVAGDFRYVTEDGFKDFEKGAADPKRGRAQAFAPGGPVAKRLATRRVIVAIGDSVFVHGGVLPGHVRYGIGRINEESRRWMLGEKREIPSILAGDTAPIWARDYSDGEPNERVCEALSRVLDDLKVKRMVVGHTVQKTGITSGCGDKVWRIDVGLARHYGGRPAVLEIKGNDVRVIAAASAEAGPVAPSTDAGPRAKPLGAR
jgi:hypothetical protein